MSYTGRYLGVKMIKKKDKKEHIVTQEELKQDGELLCKFEIPGRPATKKTHQSAFWKKGKIIIMPSPQYTAYEKHCKQYCEDVWKNKGFEPMDFGISVLAHIFLNTWSVGDHVGYLQSLGDILEKWGVIADDKFIHWAEDGTHWFKGKDKENPHVEIEIRRFRHPYEDYRDGKA
jgi:hypothetical protein